jgi:catechol 2,3-dioxygenase-like lactoylglutathione lyase family enzyme
MATVRYLVSDVDAAVSFYVGQLGFQEKQRYGPAMAIVEHDGLELWLAGPSSSAARPMPDGRAPVPGGWNRLVIQVDDIDAVVQRLRAAGVSLRNEPISGPGGSQVLVEDPSGNPIELFAPR